MKQITITDNESGQRFDKFLIKYFNNAPKSYIYKMLRKKNIKLNSARAAGNEMLVSGDLVTVWLSDETVRSLSAERELVIAGGLNIVFEDENIIVCDKPPGILSQPDGKNESMVDRLLHYLNLKGEYLPDKATAFVPSVCNRLDRNTGGLLLCAKNLASAQALGEIFAGNNIDKYYLALVAGKINSPGLLKGFHSKDKEHNMVKISGDGSGSTVLTEFWPLVISEKFTLLRVRLITGKSHQIRAHLASIGHPIAGDPKYGDKKLNADLFSRTGINAQMLYAESVVMKNPSGRLEYLRGMEFKGKPPEVFERVMSLR